MINTDEIRKLNEKNILNLAGIIRESFVDGPGIRYVVFAQGCPHHCEGCHNPESHAFEIKNKIAIDTIFDDIKKNPLIDGITLSGGEPFCQGSALSRLCRMCHDNNINTIAYTGYTIEELLCNMKNPDVHDLLSEVDILVDGKFMLSERSLMLRFRGSRNQRVIDVKKTLENYKNKDIMNINNNECAVIIDWEKY